MKIKMKTKLLYGMVGILTFLYTMLVPDAANGVNTGFAHWSHATDCEFEGSKSEYYDWHGLYDTYTSGTVFMYFCPVMSALSWEGGTYYAELTAETLDTVEVLVYDGNDDPPGGLGHEVTACLCYVLNNTTAFNVSCGSCDTSNNGHDYLYPGLPPNYRYENSFILLEGYYPYKDASGTLSYIQGYAAYDSFFD